MELPYIADDLLHELLVIRGIQLLMLEIQGNRVSMKGLPGLVLGLFSFLLLLILAWLFS